MGPTEIGVLALIVVAFAIFGGTLFYYGHRSN